MTKTAAHEGEQIKLAIRSLFERSRTGEVFTEDDPLRVTVEGVNGDISEGANATLCLHKLEGQRGKLVLWYE